MLLSVFIEKMLLSLKPNRRESQLLLCIVLGLFSSSSHSYDLVLNCGDLQRTLVLTDKIAIDADGSIVANSDRTEDCLSDVTPSSAGDGQRLLQLTCPSDDPQRSLTRDIVVSDLAQSESNRPEALVLLADNSGASVYAVNDKDCADPTPSLDSFSAGLVSNGEVVRVGGNSSPTSVSLSWNAPLADSCSVVGSLVDVIEDPNFGKPLANKSTGLSIPLDGLSSDAAYSVGIQCQRGGGALQSEFAGISLCGVGRELPEDWSRQLDCVHAGPAAGATCNKWFNLWGTSFASASGNTRNIVMSRNRAKEYVSLQFQMQSEDSKRFGTLDTRGNVQIGRGPVNSEMIITVSECPGDFDRDLVLKDGGCYHSDVDLLTSSTAWQGPNSSVSRGCKLSEQRNYFLNIIHSKSVPGTKPAELEVHPNCDNFYGCGAQWTPYSFEPIGN